MFNGSSRPLTAPLIDHEALRKHGLFYAGPPVQQHPATRQNQPESGNKNNRRDRKSPSLQPKDHTMTTSAQTHSNSNSNKNKPVDGDAGNDGLTAGDIASAVDSAMQQALPTIVGAALVKELGNLQGGFETAMAKIAPVLGNSVGASVDAAMTRISAEFRTANEATAKLNASVDVIVTGVNEAKLAAIDAAVAGKQAETAVKDMNKVLSLPNLCGDLRQVSVAGAVFGIVAAIVWAFGKFLGESEATPTTTVVRRTT